MPSPAVVRALALAVSGSYKLQRLFGMPPRTLAAVAQTSRVIYRGGRVPAPPPVIPEGHLDRIQPNPTGGDGAETAEAIRRSLHCDHHDFLPVTVHEVRHAWLVGSYLFVGRYKDDLFTRGRARLLSGPAAEVETASLAATYSGSRWFGHLILDELPRQMLGARFAPPVGDVRPEFAHEPRYRALLDIPSPARFAALHARTMFIPEEQAQNPDKIARYGAMRARLGALPRGHDRVFLQRGTAWGEARRLVNEDALRARLEREGFHSIDPTRCTVDEIVQRCNGASVVVSVEGSHACPAYLFMRAGGRLMLLHPPNRVIQHTCRIAPFFDLVGALFVCEPADAAAFSADPEEVVRTVEQSGGHAQRHAAAFDHFKAALQAEQAAVAPYP